MALSKSKVQILLNRMRKQLKSKKQQSPKFQEENQNLVDECRVHYPDSGLYGVLDKMNNQPVDAVEFFAALIHGVDSYPQHDFFDCHFEILSDSKKLASYLLPMQFALMLFPQLELSFTFQYHNRSEEDKERIRKFINVLLRDMANYTESFESLHLSHLHLGQDNRIMTLTELFSKAKTLRLTSCHFSGAPIRSLIALLKKMDHTETLDFSYTSLWPLQSNLFNSKPTPFQLFCNELVAMPALKHLVLKRSDIQSLQPANLKYLLDALKTRTSRADLPPLAISFDINPYDFTDIPYSDTEGNSPTIQMIASFIRGYPGTLTWKFNSEPKGHYFESTFEYRKLISRIEERFLEAGRSRDGMTSNLEGVNHWQDYI